MKCPNCSFHTSPKKDICPRCETDLRSRKAELGIAVANPAAPVSALVDAHRKSKPLGHTAGEHTPAPVPPQPIQKKPSIWSKWFSGAKKPTETPALTSSTKNPAKAEVKTRIFTQPMSPTLSPQLRLKLTPPRDFFNCQAATPAPEKAKPAPVHVAAPVSTPVALDVAADDDGELEFRLHPNTKAPTAFLNVGDQQLAEVDLGASTVPPMPPAAEEEDLRELISALEDFQPGELSSSASADAESLFAKPVGSIDANLDEIIQALDDVEPTAELDDYSLFDNQLSAIADSLESNVEEAKEATVSLQETEFPEPDEAPTIEVPALPNVAPSVMEFDEEDDHLLEQQLDEMLGGTEVDIESVTAVKAPPKTASAPEPESFAIDDMEISIEVDGEEEAVTEEEVSDTVDEPAGVLKDLLSTYASLEQNLQEHSITQESADVPLAPAEPSPEEATLGEFETADQRDLQVMSTLRDAGSTLSKLHSLDDALFDEVSSLLAKSLGVEKTAVARTARNKQAASKPAQSTQQMELQMLSDELGSELDALQAEGLTIFGVDAPAEEPAGLAATEFESNGELSALQGELAEEIQALESDGASFHADITDAISLPTTIDPAPELDALESELNGELNALAEEGMSFHSEPGIELATEEQIEPVIEVETLVETPELPEELAMLEAELHSEISELEQEGTSFHHDSEAEVIAEEDFNTADMSLLPSEVEEVSESAIDESPELAALEQELRSEISELEKDGLSFHAAGEVDAARISESIDFDQDTVIGVQSEVTANFEIPAELAELEQQLNSEISELESEGTSFHSEETVDEAVSAPAVETWVDITAEEPEGDLEPAVAVETNDARINEAAVGDEIRHLDVIAEELPVEMAAEIEVSEAATEEGPTGDDVILEPAVELLETDNEEIVDLSQISELFHPTPKKPEPRSIAELAALEEGQPLESAVSTGVFLAADLARIVDTPKPSENAVHIADENWEDVLREIADNTSANEEIEIGAGELAAMRQSATTSVLFDLIEEEIVDPGKKRVHEIPTSQSVHVENSKLKSALTVFESEEKRAAELRKLARIHGEDAVRPKQTVEIVPASAWQRLAAMVVDGVVIASLGAVFGYVSFIPPEIIKGLAHFQINDIDAFVMASVVYVQLLFGLWIVLSTLMISGRGQTLGGQLLRLEVVDEQARVPGFGQAFLRALSQVTTLLSFGMGLLPLIGQKRRTLHDRMAGTFVRAKVGS